MNTLPLGSSGTSVSAICLGTMYFGSTLEGDKSYPILDAYRSAGGTFLDTANIYAGWIDGFSGDESETLLGQWMQSRQCRDEIFLATKVGGILHQGHEHLDENQPRLTAQVIMSECEQSLRRLQCETIDLYYAHVDDRLTPFEETLTALDKLKQQGKIRYAGASNIASWRLAEARLLSEIYSLIEYCCVQQKFTYLHPDVRANFAPQVAVTDDLLDYCNSNSITLLAYSPLIGGAYMIDNRSAVPPPYQTSHLDKQFGVLKEVATNHEASLNQVVLAWMLQQENPILPVMGVDNLLQLNENLGALVIDLSEDEINQLNHARVNLE